MDLSVQEEIKTYDLKECNFLKQFVILGVSHYSDPELVVQAMNVLNQVLQKGEDELYKIIQMIRKVSKHGLGVNQSALLLCLVYCYQQDRLTRITVGEIIPDLCRIPTQLFLFLKFLKEFTEKGPNVAETGSGVPEKSPGVAERGPGVAGTAQFYKSLLSSLGSNAVTANSKNRKAKEPNEIAISSFIPKQKFIAKWYSNPKRTAQDLLLLLTKYSRRYDWDNKTLIKYSHVKLNKDDPEREEKNLVIEYHLKGFTKFKKKYEEQMESKNLNEVQSRIFGFIDILEQAKTGDKAEIVELLKNWKRHSNDVLRLNSDIAFTFNTVPAVDETVVLSPVLTEKKFSRLHLTIEHLPTKMYKEKEIWEELIQDMPLTAMLKHLSHMTYLGLFDQEENVKILQEALSNEERLYPFTHPFNILKALLSYSLGSSWYNDKKWTVNTDVCCALNQAFLITSKRTKDVNFNDCLVCIEISEPMRQNGFIGFDRFSAVMASVSVATTIEKLGNNNNIYICGNESRMFVREGLMERLEEIKHYDDNVSNLSQPILEALNNKKHVDAFILFTMSMKESIRGISPYETFKQYREVVNSNAKLVICSMNINSNVIADPTDSSVVTVCGADADLLPEIYAGVYPDTKMAF